MKLKRFFGVALTLCMLVGTFPQNVFAGDKSFGGRSQVKWDDSSVEKKRNGTVALESGKNILLLLIETLTIWYRKHEQKIICYLNLKIFLC